MNINNNNEQQADEVSRVYQEIFALDSIEKQNKALKSWYAYLEETCTSANPCIECMRQSEGGE